MYLCTLLLLIVFLGSSCSTPFQNQPEIFETVEIHGTVHKPYCGGAKPSLDIAAGYYEPLSGQSFKVYRGREYSDNLPLIREFTLDQDGNTTLKLPPDNYLIIHKDKSLPLDKFQAKYSEVPNQYYKIKDTGCFNQWKNTVDINLQVTTDTVIELRLKAKCWVGTNPCMDYVGPPAP
jgi:hypothetical protein